MEYIFVPLSDDVGVEKYFPVISGHFLSFGFGAGPSAGSGQGGSDGVFGLLSGWLWAFLLGFCLNCDLFDYGISLIFCRAARDFDRGLDGL